MPKLELFEVSPEYIAYLREFDDNVLSEKTTFKQKRYVGTIVTIQSKHYFAPLSSPKEKHKKIDGKLDFYKLDSGNLGGINFNKMIPVKKQHVERIDFKEVTDKHYRYLLKKQYMWLNDRKDTVCNRASKIYVIATKNDVLKNYEEKIKERCCNFKLLEEKAEEYHL